MTLIFDLDGTLLDTLDDLWASVNHALAHFSLHLRSKCEVRQFLGNGARYLIHQSLAAPSCASSAPAEEAFVSPDLEERVLREFQSYYLEHSLDRTRPYPGIPELLRTCRQRDYRTAIVSNKPDAAVQELHRRFFADTIDLAIGEQQPAIRRKPAPDMVLAALRQLPADDHVFYIGDSEVDIATARNAAIPCIAVSWGFRDRDFLASQGYAHTIIDTPSALLPILKG